MICYYARADIQGFGVVSCNAVSPRHLDSCCGLLCCRRSRGVAPLPPRTTLALEAPDDVLMLGSSYSLSHSSSSSRREQQDSSSGHSWFNWFKGDTGSGSARDRGGERGLAEARMENKPRNEHEEVQVGAGFRVWGVLG